MHISNSKFEDNMGSISALNSNLTLSGYTKFENCMKLPNVVDLESLAVVNRRQGGAITSFKSNILFIGEVHVSDNQARYGSAIW